MNFIKKVFYSEKDENIHLQFQKFSRGEFKNKALIEAKNSKGNYTIKTSAEFANELVRIIAEKLENKKTNVKGALISTSDLEGEIDYKEKKQFQGVKRYIIDTEMSGQEIILLLKKFPKIFFALSFDAGEEKLKIKAKAPKSGKVGKEKEGEPKADFCTLKTKDKEIAQDFVFEKENFKEAKIKHTFIIDKLIYPKNETDYARIRELAKRKGKIIRKALIDGEEIISEKAFEV